MKSILALIFLFFYFLIPGYANDVNISFVWNANKEPDLAGYNLYYKMDFGPFYPGGDKFIINDPKATTYVLPTTSKLSYKRIYFFMLTAYDNSDLESEYSNAVGPVYWFFGRLSGDKK